MISKEPLSRTKALAVVFSVGVTTYIIVEHILSPGDAGQIEEVILTLILFFL